MHNPAAEIRRDESVTEKLHLDFETRSVLDLREVGLDNYARHPTTDVWCAGFAFDDEPVDSLRGSAQGVNWVLDYTQEMERVCDYISSGGIVLAHNAPFEWAIWNHVLAARYKWPRMKISQMRCTMAKSYAMALPGALEKVAGAVGLEHRKDMKGHRLMLQLCAPRRIEPDGWVVWWDDAERVGRLVAYCEQDVEVEREVDNRLVSLTDKEQNLWVLDHEINQRGIAVDTVGVQAAIKVVESESKRLSTDVARITEGRIISVNQLAEIKSWCGEHGLPVAGLAKSDIVDLLSRNDVPDDVRRVLLIRQEAGRTSTAKLEPMVLAASSDGRLRSLLQYYAASTGRWGGRRVQPHNLPRPKMQRAEIERCLGLMMAGRLEEIVRCHRALVPFISDALRSMLCAVPGRLLVAGDWANIEGRALMWLSGEEWKLDAFRAQDNGTGPDVYLIAAGDIYDCDPSCFTKKSPERQEGKVTELAFGFGGGVGAGQTMGKTYGVHMTDARMDELKVIWRSRHPATVSYWYRLEESAIEAVLRPGSRTTAGPKGRHVTWRMAGSFLWCKLPSGRALCYPYPKILPVLTPWGAEKEALTFMTVVDPNNRKLKSKIVDDPANRADWARVSTYGGSLSENVTQAVSRDILAEALVRVKERGWETVLHVHDEIVIETDETGNSVTVKELEDCMSVPPEWTAGLPIVVEGWKGKRYRK